MTTHIDPSGADEPAETPEHLPFLPLDAEPADAGSRMAGPLDFARIARQAGDAETALTHYREAQFLDREDPALALEAALYLAELGRYREAVESLAACVRRHPELPAPRFHLGVLWRQLGELEKAAQQLRRYLVLDPEDHLGAAAELAAAMRPPENLPTAYLRSLFDQYADEFDQNLIRDLNYRAPEIMRDALDRCWRPPAAGADLLDLGCGTGLGGAAFRDMARRMHGVDLSPRMIEKANVRGLYDRLAVGEAIAFLTGESHAWDLVIAADMLVYLGDLRPLLGAVHRALRAGGAFVATVEAADGDEPALKRTRRFGHPPGYLRRAAAEAGFAVALLEPASSRTERGEPVAGYVLVLLEAS